MIGYSGSGYKGMQIMPDQPTIEGDLFKAMIRAGAISKANAGDPKKSSLVRCARTDKGVHAAGNVISLKLIVEDEDVVQKINEHLPSQIRVWGIERTVGSFSCYQACDSRWYEYLIPTHCFLPPHPTSFLGKKLAQVDDQADNETQTLREAYQYRQKDVEDWWTEAEAKFIRPVLEEMDEDLRAEVSQAMYKVNGISSALSGEFEESEDEDSDTEALTNAERTVKTQREGNPEQNKPEGALENINEAPSNSEVSEPTKTTELSAEERQRRDRINEATKRLKQAYIAAKTSYRLSMARLDRIKNALEQFVGTCNHHNYTIKKAPMDPSAKRHIKIFKPFQAPSTTTETGTYIIGGTEWLSIKVHGQSFMMHQIRKMIGMATLVVRCGADPTIIRKSLASDVVIAVPKAPSLGLLLERPVFDSYNTHRAAQFEREPIAFDKYEKEMNAFKEKEIYQRIYDEEEGEHVFHTFFSQIDEYKNKAFLYLTAKGFDAAKGTRDVTNRKIEKGVRHVWKKSDAKRGNAATSSNAVTVKTGSKTQETNGAEPAQSTSEALASSSAPIEANQEKNNSSQ